MLLLFFSASAVDCDDVCCCCDGQCINVLIVDEMYWTLIGTSSIDVHVVEGERGVS